MLPSTSVSKFLIVDDDEVFRARLAKSLRARAFDVIEASTAAEGIDRATLHQPQYILTDLRMPGASGLDFIRSVKSLPFNARIVVFTGYGSIATAVEAVRLGATHYLTKPADLDEILEAFTITERPKEVEIGDSTPSLSQVEWEHIQRVLTDCGGNITKAAKRLGLHRRSLQRKLDKLP